MPSKVGAHPSSLEYRDVKFYFSVFRADQIEEGRKAPYAIPQVKGKKRSPQRFKQLI